MWRLIFLIIRFRIMKTNSCQDRRMFMGKCGCRVNVGYRVVSFLCRFIALYPASVCRTGEYNSSPLPRRLDLVF